jgi:hypothetical protein
MERLANIYYYYFLIGGAIALIIYDSFAIYNDQSHTTAFCLLINLIMFTYTYYQLFMRDKNESTLLEKIVLVILLLIIIIGSLLVYLNTSFLK